MRSVVKSVNRCDCTNNKYFSNTHNIECSIANTVTTVFVESQESLTKILVKAYVKTETIVLID